MSLQIGPRMTLQLIKIQEGVGEGNVLFHSFGEDGAWGLRPSKVSCKVQWVHLILVNDLFSVHKTEEELQAILAAKEEKLRLKAQRQAHQAQNVQRKQEQRESHKYVAGG